MLGHYRTASQAKLRAELLRLRLTLGLRQFVERYRNVVVYLNQVEQPEASRDDSARRVIVLILHVRLGRPIEDLPEDNHRPSLAFAHLSTRQLPMAICRP